MKIRGIDHLRSAVAQDHSFSYLAFWGHTAGTANAIGKECFSQWYRSPFTADGCHYRTAEHFMMAAKARLFGDPAALQQVLEASTPGAAKAVGREIAGFSEPTWLAHRWQIVVNANLGKFGADPALARFLLATGEAVLVEASPVDAIWGIGLAADHADAGDPARWRGLNLLGFALMEVRDQLRAGAVTPV
jgi:ribA/ribD-fused uncharacterized protein